MRAPGDGKHRPCRSDGAAGRGAQARAPDEQLADRSTTTHTRGFRVPALPPGSARRQPAGGGSTL